MTRRLLAAFGALLLLIAMPVVRAEAAAAAGAPITPLEHGHAHNDYLNQRPVLDALDHGFTSLEADVFLRGGSLVLCHEEASCSGAKSFETYYLQRLRDWISWYGGQVYADYTQPVYLYVEIKCREVAKKCDVPPGGAATNPNNPTVVATQIMTMVNRYRSILYHYDGDRHWGPVQVVLTGGHNLETHPLPGGGTGRVIDLLDRQTDRYVFLDGTLGDAPYYNADLVPTISFDPKMRDECDLVSGADLDPYWDRIVDAQTKGHHVRVYNLPDCPGRGEDDNASDSANRELAWERAIWGGVDYVSTDHLTMLRDWLTDNALGGGGGDCGFSLWLDWVDHYGQFCSVRKAGVPVYRSPDQDSEQVGQLDEGGYANWFVGQQPGGHYYYREFTNYWWAYTQAANGQWGWVSLVYFSGGSDDQSANGLQYGCYDVRPGEPDNCHPL